MDYTEIKTYQDACKKLSIDPEKLPIVDHLPERNQKWLITSYKLAVITQAINTDKDGNLWEPDYKNPAQWKFFPYFWIDPKSGFGFSRSHYVHTFTTTSLGSRLCFDTAEKVDHVQKHFEDLWIDFLLIKK